MSTTISVRLPEEMAEELERVSQTIERPKTYIVKKALEEYLREYSDYLIAIERLMDKDDETISADEMRERLGL